MLKYMTQSLNLDHGEFISAKEASFITGYTSDYVGQLCRGGKVESKMIGRAWFVNKDSILQHKEFASSLGVSKFSKVLSETEVVSNSTSPVSSGSNTVSTNQISSKTVTERFVSTPEKDTFALETRTETVSSVEISGKDLSFLPELSPKAVVPKIRPTRSGFNFNSGVLRKAGTFAFAGALVFGSFFLSQTDYPKVAYQELVAMPAKIPLYARVGALSVSDSLASFSKGVSRVAIDLAENSRQAVALFSESPKDFLTSTSVGFSNHVFMGLNSVALDSKTLTAAATNAVGNSAETIALNVYDAINTFFRRSGQNVTSGLSKIFPSKTNIVVSKDQGSELKLPAATPSVPSPAVTVAPALVSVPVPTRTIV